MALGTNNQQNNKGPVEPTYYSRLRFKNDEDKLSLSSSFWKGTLKLSITERTTDMNTRAEELAYIHLSPVKAAMLANYVQKVIDSPESEEIYGVNTGASDTQGLLVISRENGRPYIIVAKVDKDGQFVQSQRYNFNYNYHFGLNISDIQKLSFSKEYNDNIELIQLRDLLADYSRAASGAIGASVMDIARYEIGKLTNTINKMAEKVGVETGRSNGGYNSGGNAGNSFFNNNEASGKNQSSDFGMNKPSGYSSGTIDDLDSEFD